LLGRIDQWKMWVLCDRDPIPSWGRGRTTLLGDAAHPMLQYLAQGGTMAMEDALCVADCLATEPDVEQALRRYEGSRYLRTSRVQLTARFYGEIYHAQGAAAAVRDRLLGARTPQQAYEGMA